jgi:sigma-E factor negative regulatory protein RseC
VIEQQGEVIAVENGRAAIRLGGRVDCAACAAGRGCGAGVFGRLLKRRPVELTLANELGVSRGQAVIVGLSESLFLRLAARFYLAPLLAGLVGAAFGLYLCDKMESTPAVSDVVSLLGALLAGGAVFWRNRERPAEFPEVATVRLLRVVQNQRLN